jgi:hypothetical protein
MKVHMLKTIPEMLAQVWVGAKTAELRLDDREFELGDYLWLREYDEGYRGRYVLVQVTHLLKDFPGLAPGYAMLSFRSVEKGSGPVYRHTVEEG